MKIIAIEDKNKLNEFIIRAGGSFLQSFEWGEFQKKIREKIWRLSVEDPSASSGQAKLVAAATIIKKRLPFGKSYFYSPRGPIGNFQFSILNFQLVFDFLFNEIKKIAESEKVIFLRFDQTFNFQLSTFNFQKTLDVQPSKTLILDLTKSEEELLADMHQKTRYNIKLAEKKGVKIVEAGVEKFEEFWDLMGQTSGRDKFRPHGRDYYKAMLQNRNSVSGTRNRVSEAVIKLFFAKYQSKPIATGIFSFFGNTAIYLHGGSADEYRNVMAPYLLQWHVIKLAKSSGFRYYDFYGIDENKWPGVTRFKKGFGGDELNYPGTFDLVFDKKWYRVYKMVRKIRRNF